MLSRKGAYLSSIPAYYRGEDLQIRGARSPIPQRHAGQMAKNTSQQGINDPGGMQKTTSAEKSLRLQDFKTLHDEVSKQEKKNFQVLKTEEGILARTVVLSIARPQHRLRSFKSILLQLLALTS